MNSASTSKVKTIDHKIKTSPLGLIINFNDLPITILFKTKEGETKEYVLKTNNKQDKLMLNKKE